MNGPLLHDLELKIREIVSSSDRTIPEIRELLFPTVAGYPDVKLSLMCLLANPYDGARRERIHVLLYGKPGCGKTALMEPLETNWGALYLSMDPSGASLKGDSRREDHGAKILNQSDGGIVCIDDIELMKDMNVLRDVMESGKYTITKNGIHVEYAARCRLIGATNDIKKVPKPIVNRFDLVHKFDAPTVNQSMEILKQMLRKEFDGADAGPLLQYYYYLAQSHDPQTIDEPEIQERFRAYFEANGEPVTLGNDSEEKEGKEGRWIAGVLRIAKGLARINLTTLGPEQITLALDMKRKSDLIITELKC